MRPLLVSSCEPTGMLAALVNGLKPFGGPVARAARPLPGSLMNTSPDTTFTTTDLPGTGGGGGGGADHVTVAVRSGSLASRMPLSLMSVNAAKVSVPAFFPIHEIAAVPSALVVTAPAPGLAPAIASRTVRPGSGPPSALRAVTVTVAVLPVT